MPKAVVWDIGNVIVRWDPRTLYSQIFPDPADCDRFLNSVCTMAWHVRHDLGVTFAENRAPLLEAFPEHAEHIHAWETRWWDMFSGAIPETVAAIEALAARGVPQFGLSNMSHEVVGGIAAVAPAFAHLADVVISAETAVLKPDPRIYAQACARFGYAPGDLFFIDDSAKNIEGAKALGWDAHHFTDPTELRPALEARGFL